MNLYAYDAQTIGKRRLKRVLRKLMEGDGFNQKAAHDPTPTAQNRGFYQNYLDERKGFLRTLSKW